MSLDDTTRRDALKLLGTGAAVTTLGTGTVAAGEDGGPVLEIKSMVGNTLTGSDGAIRGIDAGGLPWVVDEAEVKLDGEELKVEVEGLVLADDSSVPEAVRGTNPIPEFTAILSCLTFDDGDGDGHVTETVRTDTYEAAVEGNAEIEEVVDVPAPCLAPIVFVAGPEEHVGASSDLWFAVTGV